MPNEHKMLQKKWFTIATLAMIGYAIFVLSRLTFSLDKEEKNHHEQILPLSNTNRLDLENKVLIQQFNSGLNKKEKIHQHELLLGSKDSMGLENNTFMKPSYSY